MQRTKPFVLKLFFSNRYSYAQILRRLDGNIVAAASTIEKDLRTTLDSTSDKEVRQASHSRTCCPSACPAFGRGVEGSCCDIKFSVPNPHGPCIAVPL